MNGSNVFLTSAPLQVWHRLCQAVEEHRLAAGSFSSETGLVKVETYGSATSTSFWCRLGQCRFRFVFLLCRIVEGGRNVGREEGGEVCCLNLPLPLTLGLREAGIALPEEFLLRSQRIREECPRIEDFLSS